MMKFFNLTVKKVSPKNDSPQMKGETSISGHMAGLDSDDNAKSAAQRAGLNTENTDVQNPLIRDEREETRIKRSSKTKNE